MEETREKEEMNEGDHDRRDETDRDRQTDRQTNRQTDRQTDRQAEHIPAMAYVVADGGMTS